MRPQLNRNAASHQNYTNSNDLASLSSSMDTDGTSHTQSEDGASLPEFGDHLDATTFEQVRFLLCYEWREREKTEDCRGEELV